MASDKKFDVYDLAFTAPWAFFGDVFILVGLAALLIPVLGIPIFALMFMLNFLIIVGLFVWFFIKWRRIAKQDGVGVGLIFGSLITWAVFIAGVSILGLFFPTKLISLFLSAGLTNHYKGVGKVGDLALDAVLIFVPGPGWGGLALKEGGEIAAKEAVEVAAKRAAAAAAARQTGKVAGRTLAAETGEAGAEKAAGRFGRLRQSSGDYVKDKAEEYAKDRLMDGSSESDESEEKLPWEEKSEFEKLHEYFETVPEAESHKEDGAAEGDVVIDDDQNEVDLRNL